MPRILIIVAYFGRLPSYFDLWLRSCAFNEKLNWLVVTDEPALPANVPENVVIQRKSFESFHQQLRERVGVAPDRLVPYKIVDFKPAYGHIFREEIMPYDFWGCCDLDMIFGDVLSFIPSEVFKTYEKIFNRGHLTLYRNSKDANAFYRLKAPGIDWESILRDPRPFGYDEWRGIHSVLNQHEIAQYHDEVIADIDPLHFRFTTTKHHNHSYQIFCWDDGRVYRIRYDKGKVLHEEFAYIHFQKRSLDRGSFQSSTSAYYVTPYGFIEKRGGQPSLELIRKLNDPSVLERSRYNLRRTMVKLSKFVPRIK